MEQDYIALLNHDYILAKHPVTGREVKLFRIISTRAFQVRDRTIEKYKIGGYVQSLSNIDMNTYNWIDNTARVFGDSFISDNTLITHNALVFENAKISNSLITDYVRVYGNAIVNNSILNDLVEVRGMGEVNNSTLINSAVVIKHGKIDNCKMSMGSYVSDDAQCYNCTLEDFASATGDVILHNCQLKNGATVSNGEFKNTTFAEDYDLKYIKQIE